MATHQPTELSQGFAKPEPKIEDIAYRCPVQFTAGVEAKSINDEHGAELTQEFAGDSFPVAKTFQEFELSRLKIDADSGLSEEGKERDIAKATKPCAEEIKKADARKAKAEEEVHETDKKFLEAGEITRPESITPEEWFNLQHGVNAALQGHDSDALKREVTYRDAHEALLLRINAPWAEKSLLLVNIAVLETKQVLENQKKDGVEQVTSRLAPFVSPALVREMRMQRGRLQMVKAAKRRDERARLASAIGSVTALAKQRLAKYVPAVVELETL